MDTIYSSRAEKILSLALKKNDKAWGVYKSDAKENNSNEYGLSEYIYILFSFILSFTYS